MVSMPTSLFGDIKQGRMGRMAFVIYLFVLQILVLAYAVYVAMAAGLAERATDFDLVKAQQQLTDFLSTPFLLLSALLLTVLAFAHLNIMAKRIRDLGWPGWWVLSAYTLVRIVLWIVGYGGVGLLLDNLLLLSLCVLANDSSRAAVQV